MPSGGARGGPEQLASLVRGPHLPLSLFPRPKLIHQYPHLLLEG